MAINGYNCLFLSINVLFISQKECMICLTKGGFVVKEKLSIKAIYDDFILKVNLNEEELSILDMYLKGYSRVKMGDISCMSDRNVGRVLAKIKKKYNYYVEIEKNKSNILMS